MGLFSSPPALPSTDSSQHRRAFLANCGSGIAGVALTAMLQREGLATGPAAWQPPDGNPHFAPRAKNVIWLFMRGGVSHVESFDPKPALNKFAGKSIAETQWKYVQDPQRLKKLRVVAVQQDTQRNRLYPLQAGYRAYGESGIEVSDFFPHIGRSVDEIAIIRSMWTTDDNHGAQVQFQSGRHMLDGFFPTIGAWVTYGLGSLNDNLPQFLTMGPRFFDQGEGHYLGPAYDPVTLKIDPQNPLPYAKPEMDLSRAEQQIEFALINRLNRLKAKQYPDDPALAARIKSYELAFRMQTAVPKVVNFSDETAETLELYGMNDDTTKPFATHLLAARRLAEQGVRFIQIMHGPGAAGAWDAHGNLKTNHTKLSAQVDKPVAGLLQDLKQRGMLDETIVVFATEFGRTPGTQGGTGRDHHPFGFSVWMAGGGIKGGIAHGATDEIGFHAEQDPHYVTDIHATLMQQLGLDAHLLEVPGHKRLEIDYGHPISDIIA